MELVMAKVEDWEPMLELARESFKEAFEQDTDPVAFKTYVEENFVPERFQADLGLEQSVWMVLREGQEWIGYFRLRWDETYPSLGDKKQVKMQRLYLRKKWWNQGLGKVLLDYATEWASHQGFTDLWLVVWEKNEGAIRFYERNGYTCIGRYDFQFGHEVHHDYVMHRAL